MNCMNHPSAKKQTASLLCYWTCLGLQRCFAEQLLLLMATKFPSWPFPIFCNLMLTQEYSGHAGKWQQALPRKKPVHSIARGCFHTAGRVWGVSSGSVTLFVESRSHWVATTAGRIITFQGVWGQPTWLHRWMTVRRWAKCLLGAFCSGRNAYEGCRRNIWCILGGEAIQLVLLDQCQCADFAVELATSADVNWSLFVPIADYWSTNKLQGQWVNDTEWYWFTIFNGS